MERLKLPGFGVRLSEMPPWPRDENSKNFPNERFPNAIIDFFATEGVTIREIRMLNFINQITDKRDWETKVFDNAIVENWRDEACSPKSTTMISPVTEADEKSEDNIYISNECFDWCIKELRDKAEYLRDHNLIHVLDVNATVVKSDSAIPSELHQALRNEASRLEDIPDRLKDWHPGSKGMVLDLLHPSLFPVIYGITRVLPYSTVPLKGCNTFAASGQTCECKTVESEDYEKIISWGNTVDLQPWGNYQWLPTNVNFSRLDDTLALQGYINNLHPEANEEFYDVLEQFVARAVPLWNECLSWFHDRTRIKIEGCGNDNFEVIPGRLYTLDVPDHDYSPEWNAYQDWVEQNRRIIQPSPSEEFKPFEEKVKNDEYAERLDLRAKFDGIQVIFKLANIHLTPEKPVYSGSNWHVEGALNEHICATALYYYDSVNIEDSKLAFRLPINAEAMVMKPAQSEFAAAEALFGVTNEEPAIQELGEVLTREGRLLAFPNVLQHRVQPFGLRDKTKPGHRKILAMFLVDPFIPILSTSNAPPQRRDWWADEVRKIPPLDGLPVEIFEQIIAGVEEFPISWEKALEVREKLMEERGRMTDEVNDAMAEDTFFFCEH